MGGGCCAWRVISQSHVLLCHCAVRHFLYSHGTECVSERAHLMSCTHFNEVVCILYKHRTKSIIFLCNIKEHKKQLHL